MGQRYRYFAILAALGLTAVSIAVPQRAQVRKGFWIGLGLGYGSLGISCQSCNIGREGALSGYLKLGGTVSPKLLIGGETNGWTQGDEVAGNASLAAYYYPKVEGGLFLRGGLGLATYQRGSSDATGLGAVVGVGYDVRVGRNFSITPVANFNWGYLGNQLGTGRSQNVMQFVVGASFH